MTRRLLAWSLFILASSPFTAPFSTCDLATLFGDATGITLNAAGARIVLGAPHRLSPIEDDAALAGSLSAPTAGREKPAIAQNKFQPTSTGHSPDCAGLWVLHPVGLPDGQPVAPTILRL